MKNLRKRRETEAAASLEGETAIVTGGGRGIGRAIALRLAHAGAAVAVAARSREEVEEVTGTIASGDGQSIAVSTDVTNEHAVESLIDRVETSFGPPTLLVNNAGSWAHIGPVAESNPAAWWHDVEVSLKGTFLCARAVLPTMLREGRGRIVNVSSYAAVAPSPYMTAYACAKTAVLRFTDSLAAELESSGVFAFSITPGFVRTQLVERVAASDEGRRFLPQLEERRDALGPEGAAQLVADIASGRLDALSGRFLHVLDDVDDLLRRADEIAEHELYTLRLRTPPPQEQQSDLLRRP
jgi:NAD(P)-dependent dehydrogenase (short-subunit alcohol dehydrogenase family)